MGVVSMKKVKIITAFILIIIICAILFSNRQFAPKNYYNKVKTGGNIESKYMSLGKYDTSKYEEEVMQEAKKYIIYYPSEMENENKKYPVVVFLNDIDIPASKYYHLLEHMASWGFIAVGSESEYDWSGFSSNTTINHLKNLDSKKKYNDKNNIFYNSIDLDNVGITGYSEGAIGVLNAITKSENKDVYKCAVSISPTNKTLSDRFEWYYDASLVKSPILLISSDDTSNDSGVSLKQLKSIYNEVSGDKIMMVRKNTKRDKMIYSADGYVTAWFMYYLKDDVDASKAFMGDNAEVINNKLYKDIERSF